jgi:predicted PurR-regulated permease PerM
MRFLETPKDRAGLLILALGVAILLALVPFLSGLLGAAVLYVMFSGMYRRLDRVMPSGIASALTLIAALVGDLLLLPASVLLYRRVMGRRKAESVSA